MLHTLLFCLGFCLGIVYIDLVFDVSAMPYRRSGGALPAAVLGPISTYYRYVTKNPWLLIFVMSVALTSIVVQLVAGLAPRWVGYSSLVIFGLIALMAIARVIPGAQRLASGEASAKEQTRLAHGLLPYHLAFLVLILALAYLQSGAVAP